MSDSKWERVCWHSGNMRRDDPPSKTHRLRVPGGWLYRCVIKTVKAPDHYGMEVSMCFVPDPLEAAP
jgi:hypothetical protein